MSKILSKALDKCTGCYACESKCPQKAISMKINKEGFFYPNIDETKCVSCYLCEKICPVLKESPMKFSIEAFSTVNKEENIRIKSSSGGMFSLISQEILKDGGVVFGASFSDDFKEVNHIGIETEDKLYKLQGSKYLQSRIGKTYIEAEKYLKEGRKVLFSGTPCQIGGLYSYLQKDYDNLYTQDIICHGVPSPLVWNKYVEHFENKFNSKIDSISFRNKDTGWRNYCFYISFENKKEYKNFASQNLYMRGFLLNLFLRPSCYMCNFKGIERQADITLADFWGVENVLPKDDDKGTSLVLTNTKKGQELFELAKNSITFNNVDRINALSYNSAATKSCEKPLKRQEFFNTAEKTSMYKALNKYCKIKLSVKIKSFIKKILRA